MGINGRLRSRKKDFTIGLVCSLGGHLEQIYRLRPLYEKYDHFFLTPKLHDNTRQREGGSRFYSIVDINEGRGLKNPLLIMLAFLQTLLVFIRRRPDLIISTGAGIAIPGFLLGRLFGIRTVYIESFARIEHPSRAGKVCYRLADLSFIQHPELQPYMPSARYRGSLYEHL